ncbi:MAG: type II secretion system F family protein [Candidatus Sumerlaeaceae bacterium]|nr:type II secretion system F family protein [Candidatus Sumerlaeaceae bacterium]
MNTPKPGDGQRSILNYDLLDLPGLRWLKRRFGSAGPEAPVYDLFDLSIFRWWVWKWRSLIMANLRVRREAKAVLFGELAEALRQKMPLPEALAANSQTLEESWRRKRHGVGRGADSRHSIVQRFTALFIVGIGFVVFLIYTALSFRYTDPERVARLMANRLHKLVVRGVPLSEAMRRCHPDYDRAEVAIVENAEKWGNLPEAIQRLSAYQVTEKTLTGAGVSAMYPVILAYVLLFPVGFIQILLLPKFADIYVQLQADVPALTRALMNFNPTSFPIVLATVAWWLLILFWIVRAVMNGNFMARYIIGLGILSFGFWFASPGGVLFPVWCVMPLFPWDWATRQPIVGVIPLVLFFTALIMPYLLARVEVWILAIERASGRLLPWLPFLGRTLGKAAKAEADSRWLAALSTALSAGVPAPDALRMAGATVGGVYRRRSEAAASLALQGLSLGGACVRAGVLEPRLNHRLVLADRSPQFMNALQAIAEDAGDNAQQVLSRTARIAEVAGQVLVGCVMAAAVIAIYLPLFNIPRIFAPLSSQAPVMRPFAGTVASHPSADPPFAIRRV